MFKGVVLLINEIKTPLEHGHIRQTSYTAITQRQNLAVRIRDSMIDGVYTEGGLDLTSERHHTACIGHPGQAL